jgi:hypothetical protein
MGKKDRVPVPADVATLLMFRSDRTCCVCHERGEPIQIHHIDEDPSNNNADNLAVLCFHCHDETQIRGGFGRKLDAAQVIYYRDDWHRRVEIRREAADKIALAREAGHVQATARAPMRRDALPDAARLTNYIRTLPTVRKDIYGRSKPKWDSGNTPQMKRGSFDVIDVLEQILITLATWYPPRHFGGREPQDYINAVIASRFSWHRAHLEPNGIGTGGAIIGTMAGGCVLDDLERMVLDLVSSLAMDLADFDFTRWKEEWDSACEPSPIGPRLSSPQCLESELGEIVPSGDYAKRILGRWLGPRKYVVFYADGRFGVQRNEDAPVEIAGRRWRIEGNKLIQTIRTDSDVVTHESTITSFRTRQFVIEFHGQKRMHDWAP